VWGRGGTDSALSRNTHVAAIWTKLSREPLDYVARAPAGGNTG
jgi:hypothetical protein